MSARTTCASVSHASDASAARYVGLWASCPWASPWASGRHLSASVPCEGTRDKVSHGAVRRSHHVSFASYADASGRCSCASPAILERGGGAEGNIGARTAFPPRHTTPPSGSQPSIAGSILKGHSARQVQMTHECVEVADRALPAEVPLVLSLLVAWISGRFVLPLSPGPAPYANRRFPSLDPSSHLLAG